MDDQSIQENEKIKKRFLRRYQNNLSCISRLEAKLVILDERITTIKSPNYSGMPRGGVPVTLDDLLSDKDDLERRIKNLKAKGLGDQPSPFLIFFERVGKSSFCRMPYTSTDSMRTTTQA